MTVLSIRSTAFGLLLAALPVAANAQVADGGNYLRLPPSYQQAAPQPVATNRATFNGQGMGRGQVLQPAVQGRMPSPSMAPLGTQPMMQPLMQQPTTAMSTNASSRMLPPGASTNAGMDDGMQPLLQPAMQTDFMQGQNYGQNQAQIQGQIQGQPQAAVRPVVMTHQSGMAGSMPLTDSSFAGGQTNVQLRPTCDTPNNHRAANKGLNTSTTIHGDCLD